MQIKRSYRLTVYQQKIVLYLVAVICTFIIGYLVGYLTSFNATYTPRGYKVLMP